MAKFASSFSKWASGVCKFKALSDGRLEVKVKVWDRETKKTVLKKYIFHDSLMPKVPAKIHEEDEYFVELVLDDSGNGVEKVYSIRPSRWSDELMLVVDMTRPGMDEANPPAAYGPDTYGRMKINAFLAFQEGEFKGVRVPYNLLDKFQNDGHGEVGFAFTQDTLDLPNASRIREFFEFYDGLMGVLDDPIEWPDDGNPYPELLDRIKANKRYVRTSGKEGRVIDIYPDRKHKEEPEKASFDEVVEELDKEKEAVTDEWGDDFEEDEWKD